MVLLPISGIEVDFPFSPYGVQRLYMARMIAALRDGENACLESPTGTGKTLSLLCAALAWRQAYVAALQLKAKGVRDEKLFRTVGLPLDDNPEANASSGQPSNETPVANALEALVRPSSGKKELSMPRIIFSSRTHSQLAQAIRELKATVYRPQMTILGSRDQLCIHDIARKYSGSKLNSACRQLTAPNRRGCKYYLAVASQREHENRSAALLQALKDEPVRDIEDLAEFGQQEGACPYFLARKVVDSDEADVIFMPYNYLLDVSARGSLAMDWTNDVLIVDEAHNLEGVCSETMSFDLTQTMREGCKEELLKCVDGALKPGGVSFPALDELAKTDEGAARVVGSENTQVIELRLLITILEQIERAIAKVQLEPANPKSPVDSIKYAAHPVSFLRTLFAGDEGQGITEETCDVVIEALDRAITSHTEVLARVKSASGAASAPAGEGSSAGYLKTLRESIQALFDPSNRGGDESFRAVVTESEVAAEITRCVSLWCFDPAVCMGQFKAHGIRSWVLTSGTLSPISTLSSELGMPFKVQLENRHVIGSDQVWGAVVGQGPDGCRLSSGYQIRETDKYKLSMGRSLVQLAEVVPDGILVFFPSYGAMDSCMHFWKTVGLGNHGQRPSVHELLQQRKRVVVEPRDASQFAAAILAHQTNIDGGHGSILLAVCRGKVSEGIDFSDAYGRAVVVAGIPYPAAFDPKVVLKRKYMDARAHQDREAETKGPSTNPSARNRDLRSSSSESSQVAVDGEEWYTSQALRAVNQAIGRVIRHRNDYGVILFLDERFGSPALQAKLSKWLRPFVTSCATFEDARLRTAKFFEHSREADFAQTRKAKAARLVSEGDRSKSRGRTGAAGLSRTDTGQEEAIAAVERAAQAISRFVPQRRSRDEIQADLDALVHNFSTSKPPKESVDEGPAQDLLGVLGSKPTAAGSRAPDDGHSRTPSETSKSIQRIARGGVRPHSGRSEPSQQRFGSQQPSGGGRRREGARKASGPPESKSQVRDPSGVVESSLAVFGGEKAKVRELVQILVRIRSSGQTAIGQSYPFASPENRASARAEIRLEIKNLIEHVLQNRTPGATQRDVDLLLRRMSDRLPASLREEFLLQTQALQAKRVQS